MAKPVPHALLKAVGETPLLTNILEMAGDLDHVQIARFNKTFHNAIQKLQGARLFTLKPCAKCSCPWSRCA